CRGATEGNSISERRCARGNFQFRRQYRESPGGIACGKVSVLPAVTRQDSRRSGALREKKEGDQLNGFRRSAAKDVVDVSAARANRGNLPAAVSVHSRR